MESVIFSRRVAAALCGPVTSKHRSQPHRPAHWQAKAKASAESGRNPLGLNVGQALSPANPEGNSQSVTSTRFYAVVNSHS